MVTKTGIDHEHVRKRKPTVFNGEFVFSKIGLPIIPTLSFPIHISFHAVSLPYYNIYIKISKAKILYFYIAIFIIQCPHSFSCSGWKVHITSLQFSAWWLQLQRKLHSANNNGKSWLKILNSLVSVPQRLNDGKYKINLSHETKSLLF